MRVLDTTVLVYAVGAEHPLREPARRLVAAVAEGTVQASTTPEVLQEFAYVRARRRGREDARALTLEYAELLAPLLVVETRHLTAGLELWRTHPELGAFDAVLAAVALAHDAPLVSADAAFGAVPALEWLDLTTA